MIYILTEYKDFSANYVCQWLNFMAEKYFRINSENNSNLFETVKLNNKILDIKLESKESLPSIIWNRRGYFNMYPKISKELKESEINKKISFHLNEERQTLTNFIYEKISPIQINHPSHYDSNKLIGLSVAKNVGFNIPDTIITKRKDILLEFMQSQNRIISKNIQDFCSFSYKKVHYLQRTFEITDDIIKDIPDTFYYSLFQKYIEQKFELRIFHFCGKNFTTACIFPDEFTDSRFENGQPNRITPFSLPVHLDNRVNHFMKEMGLESGSIDLIYDKNEEYYFLEVNPVGQFDYVDKNSNYKIDKYIANFLKSNSNDIRKAI